MKYQNLLLLVFILFNYSILYANAGTPLMWAGFLHLYVINFLIGIFESILLIRKFRDLSRTKIVLLIIIANFISMYLGYLSYEFLTSYSGIDVFNPSNSEYIILNLLFYFALTLSSMIIEYPFFWICLLKETTKTIISTTIKINIISAVVVVLYYILFHLIIFIFVI